MRKILILAGTATLALTACSENSADTSAAAVEEVTEAPAAAEMAADAVADVASKSGALPNLADIPVSLPQLAYIYDYRWRMPAAEIGTLQRRHASLCEQQGPAICQIIGMTKSGEDEGEVTGRLEMAVASRQARAFGALLEDEAQDAGAEQVAARAAGLGHRRAVRPAGAEVDAVAEHDEHAVRAGQAVVVDLNVLDGTPRQT
jgi:hypothetical protein